MILRFLTDGDSEGTSKPWAANIGAAVLVQLATFSGLLAIALSKAHRSLCPQQNEKLNKNSKLWKCAVELGIPSFAAGALLATAFFLIIPEALELLGGHHGHEEEGNDEQEVAWKFGTALMAGFIFPVLLSSMFPSSVHHTDKESPHSEVYGNVSEVDKVSEDLWEVTESIALDVNDGKNDEEVPDKTARPFKKGESKSDDEQTEMIKSCSDKCDTLAPEDTLTPGRPPQVVQCKNYSLAASILLGDMFHNATDGFFIGTAFLLCSRSLAWTIVASTVYHELAQEIADYFLLTHHCGLTMCQALTLNFLSGCSVIIGAVIVFSLHLHDEAIGGILSASAGVYIYIAVGECVPRIQRTHVSGRHTLVFLLCFVLGAVPIGLVLLNHVHCESGH